MIDNAPTTTANESKRVASLIAGAFVFYICIAIVAAVSEALLPTPSGGTIAVWFLGAGLSSTLGVGVARRLAPNFNRIGLILLMVAPIALFAVATFLAADHFTGNTIANVLCALLGTAVGLGNTFRDLMQSKS